MSQGDMHGPRPRNLVATGLLAGLVLVLLLVAGRLGWMLYAVDLPLVLQKNPGMLPAFLFGLFLRYVLPIAAVVWYLIARRGQGLALRCSLVTCAMVPAVQCLAIATLALGGETDAFLYILVAGYLMFGILLMFIAYRLFRQRPVGALVLVLLCLGLFLWALLPAFRWGLNADMFFYALALVLPVLAQVHGRSATTPATGLGI